MGKALRPVTKASGIPKKDLKQTRGPAAKLGPDTRMTRPILPADIQALPNIEPMIGKVNPKHINMMFEFGKQSFRGTVAYGPEGVKMPSRIEANERGIITRLGNDYKDGKPRV